MMLSLKYLRSHEGIFESFDEVLSERIASKAMSIDQFATLLETLASHNQNCPIGEEVTLQMVCMEGELFVSDNLDFFEKSQLLSVIGGYTTSGVMRQLDVLQNQFES